MEQTTKKYNKNWSLTTEQVNRFKRIADVKYTDIFEVLSDLLSDVYDCKNCPVKCDSNINDCQKCIAEYIKSGTTKNKVNND